MSSEAFTIVYNKALDLVSRREHSRHELRQKLNKRFPETKPIIEEALDKLVLNNILDDFSEMLKCENFIVGNSTFSLMAAHIKENINTKIVIRVFILSKLIPWLA